MQFKKLFLHSKQNFSALTSIIHIAFQFDIYDYIYIFISPSSSKAETIIKQNLKSTKIIYVTQKL